MVTLSRDADNVHFFLDQDTELDFSSASSLEHQSAGRNVTTLGHIIANQLLFLLINAACIAQKQKNQIKLTVMEYLCHK